MEGSSDEDDVQVGLEAISSSFESSLQRLETVPEDVQSVEASIVDATSTDGSMGARELDQPAPATASEPNLSAFASPILAPPATFTDEDMPFGEDAVSDSPLLFALDDSLVQPTHTPERDASSLWNHLHDLEEAMNNAPKSSVARGLFQDAMVEEHVPQASYNSVPLEIALELGVLRPLSTAKSVLDRALLHYYLDHLQLVKHWECIREYVLLGNGLFAQALASSLNTATTTTPMSLTRVQRCFAAAIATIELVCLL